jgi:uncharacterized protein YlxP (DUF503 family)
VAVGLLILRIKIPICSSLKEKRSQLKPLLTRLGREFNVSVAELGLLDAHDESLIGCAHLSNDANHTRRSLQKIVTWVEKNFPHLDIVEEDIELI